MFNSKKRLCLIAVLLCFCSAWSARSQPCMDILAKYEIQLYQHVVNNIIYKIIYERYKCSEVGESDFRHLVARNGHSYILEFQCSEIIFPNTDCILFEYNTPRLMTTAEPDSLGRVVVGFPLGNHFNHPVDRGMILYDTTRNAFWLVSGYAFLDPIRNHYFQHGYDSSSMVGYCQVRYFNYQPVVENLSVEEKWVDFYSKNMEKYYRVDLSENHTESELLLKE